MHDREVEQDQVLVQNNLYGTTLPFIRLHPKKVPGRGTKLLESSRQVETVLSVPCFTVDADQTDAAAPASVAAAICIL